MRTQYLVAIACIVGIAVAGCSSTDAAMSEVSASAPSDAEPSYNYFDPCSQETSARLSALGLERNDLLEPIRDEYGSGCSYSDRVDNGFSVLSRPSQPGDQMDQWVHHRFGKDGPTSTTTIAGHHIEIETIINGRANQECRLIIHVDYGFLDVTGGPNGKLAPSYPRDCDAVLTFADMLTREVDARRQREN